MIISEARAIDDVIKMSWVRATRGSNNEYIFPSQIPTVLAEIESTLTLGSILTDEESYLLGQLNANRRDMKITKPEFKNLILKTVDCKSFEELFQKRFNMSVPEIRRRMTVPGSPYEEHARKPITPISRPLSSHAPLDGRPGTRTDKGVVWEELNKKDKYIQEREHEIELRNIENSNLRVTNRDQEKTIRQLDSENSVLKNHIRSLESQLSKIPGERSTRNLLTKLKDRDLVIKSLELVCEEYRNNINDFEKRDADSSKELKEIKATLEEQDRVFESLQKNLPIGSTEDTYLRGFFMNLPFIKQYFHYFRYKHENKDMKLFLLNVFVLFLTALLVGNILQLIFYVIMGIIQSSQECQGASYVYDDYSFTGSWLTSASIFENWRPIIWLEEFVYRFTDW
ncbi:hypothetical protein JA1_000404 [Spathaspora sp. JA1]|nr:hypothetical protein JA1_000404 [Spathaspora sp. JA1]